MSFDERDAKIDELINNGMWPTLSKESAFHVGFDAGLQRKTSPAHTVEVVLNGAEVLSNLKREMADEVLAQVKEAIRTTPVVMPRFQPANLKSVETLQDQVNWHHLSQMVDLLYDEIVQINTANGWKATTPDDWDVDNYRVLAFLMLASTEIAEAAEAFRKGDKENFVEEIADVFIRLTETAMGLGFDLVQAIDMKLGKNRERTYKHGGKRV